MKKKGSKKVDKKFEIELKDLKALVDFSSDQQQELNKHNNIAGICEKLLVDPNKGLSTSNEQDLLARCEQFGRNELPSKPAKSIFYFILQALRIKLLLGLIIITVLYSIISQLVLPSGIQIDSGEMDYFYLSLSHDLITLLMLLIVVFSVACYEWIKDGEMRILQSQVEIDDVVAVLRDGQLKQLRAREIVVGDVCEIVPGNTVPADGIVIQSNDLKVDESMLTGETNFVSKGPGSLVLYSGTIVNEGTGRMLVTAVGVHSQTGIIMSLLGSDSNKKVNNRPIEIEIKVHKGNENEQGEAQTMLNLSQTNRDSNLFKNKVVKLNKIIGLIGLSLTICTFVILVVRFFVRHSVQQHMLQFMLRYLANSLTLLFVIVPESLPLVYTWCISNAIERTIKNKCLIRHIISVEKLAEATTLCVGKLKNNQNLSSLCGKLKKAGLVVRLVSEDDASTARSIALSSGLVEPDEDFLVLNADEFLNGDDNGPLNEVWPRVKVIAGIQAYDKCNLLKKMKRMNEIVAVVGETTGDAAFIRKADVGFAMGLTGSQVAKEASDIIITDDDLNSILRAVLWSRNVYASIVTLLQFQFTVNTVIVCTSFLGACLFGEIALSAGQILWINLIVLSLGIISLIRDVAKEELLDHGRYISYKSHVSQFVLKYFFGQLFYQMLITLFNFLYARYFLGTSDLNSDKAPCQQYTMVFNSLVLMNLFNEINCRNIHITRNIFRNIQRNIVFCIQWVALLCLQVLIVQFGQSLFWCEKLELFQWLWCLIFAFGTLIWTQLIAFIPTIKSCKHST